MIEIKIKDMLQEKEDGDDNPNVKVLTAEEPEVSADDWDIIEEIVE